MNSDRAAFFFRLQCTLFCVFYGTLLYSGIVYFHHRLAFIANALGQDARLPKILTFAREMHHPIILLVASLAPVAFVILVWTKRPNSFLVLGQVFLMLVLILLVFLPPVATELTTSAILNEIYGEAVKKGLTR